MVRRSTTDLPPTSSLVAISQISPLSETARPTLNQSQGKYFLGSNMRKNSLRQEAKRYLTTDHRGSPRARKFRYHVIMQMIDDLFIISEIPANWKALNNQHIEQLVKRCVNLKAVRLSLDLRTMV